MPIGPLAAQGTVLKVTLRRNRTVVPIKGLYCRAILLLSDGAVTDVTEHGLYFYLVSPIGPRVGWPRCTCSVQSSNQCVCNLCRCLAAAEVVGLAWIGSNVKEAPRVAGAVRDLIISLA